MNSAVRGVPWLSTKKAAEHLGFPSVAAFHKWIQEERKQPKSKLRVHWLRGRMRFRASELDACVESEPSVAESHGLSLVR